MDGFGFAFGNCNDGGVRDPNSNIRGGSYTDGCVVFQIGTDSENLINPLFDYWDQWPELTSSLYCTKAKDVLGILA